MNTPNVTINENRLRTRDHLVNERKSLEAELKLITDKQSAEYRHLTDQLALNNKCLLIWEQSPSFQLRPIATASSLEFE